MIRPRTLVVVVLPLLGSVCACRLPGRDGPISQSLATCRQLSQQGVSALEQGQRQRAEELLAKAVKTCPVDHEARRHYAEALWQRGARSEAIAQLDEALRLLGDDAALRVRLAEMHLESGRIDLARQNVERAIDLNPKFALAWLTRGRVARTGGQLRQALDDLYRALGYAPDDRTILLEIAELHRQLNQPERALQTLQTLADTYTPGEEPPHVLQRTALAQAALGRHDAAAETFAAAVARGNPNADLLCQLAEAQLLAGRAQEAVASAERAIEIQPDHQPSRALLQRIAVARQPEAGPRR